MTDKDRARAEAHERGRRKAMQKAWDAAAARAEAEEQAANAAGPTPREQIERWMVEHQPPEGTPLEKRAVGLVRAALAIIDTEMGQCSGPKRAWPSAPRHIGRAYCSCGRVMPCTRTREHEAALWQAIQGE
jgi:hypothetical protein